MKLFHALAFVPMLFSFSGIALCKAVDFQATSVTAEDKKAISSILSKQEAKWVPAEELKKYPSLYWQDELQKQSFKITSSQNGIEDTYLVPIQADYINGTQSQRAWDQSLSILLINRKNSTIVSLPEHPVLKWNFDHIEGVAFRDVQGNGKRSIIVDAAGITGMGENGTKPFDVIAIYLPNEDGTWRLDQNLQKEIANQMYKKCKKASCRNIKTIAKFAESYFKKRR